MRFPHLLVLVLACVAAAPARAVESCDLDGQHVNPNNGNTTAGKTDDERGRVARERELDTGGNVVRDDEVFEDGSRKAYGR